MPSATFNGQTYQFPEGTSEDQMLQYINSRNGQVTPSYKQEQPQQQPQTDDGSVLDTIGSGLSRMGRNTLAAFTTDKDSSDYELMKAKKASQEYQTERNKLGTLGGLAADIGTYAPVVAGSIVAPEIGALVMGGMMGADTLAQQQEAGKQYDVGDAITTGAASGATDLATMGLASRGMNIARGLTSPTKRAAAEVGTMATQAGLSNAAANSYQNIALGRPWDQNLGEAALIGGLTGGGIHGAVKGTQNMIGYAQGNSRPVNSDGQRLSQDSATVSEEAGTVHQDFGNSAAEHANEYGNQFNELMDMPVTAETTSKIDNMMDVSMSPSGLDDAALSAISLAQRKGAPLTAKALDIEAGNGKNLARDYMGKSERDLERAGGTIYSNMSPVLFGREKARAKGYDSEIQQKNLKTAFDDGYADIVNPIKSIRSELQNQINDRSSSLYQGGRADPNYITALNAAKALEDGMTKYASGKAIHKMNPESMRSNSVTLMRSLNELGMLRDLKNFDGTAFNPIKTVQSAYMYSDMFHKQNPSIHDYNPNTLKQEGKEITKVGPTDIAMDAMLMHAGLPPVKTISKLARGGIKPMKARKAFDEAIGEAGEFVTGAARQMQQRLNRGDSQGASNNAEASLNDMGIDVSTRPVTTESTTPVEAPVRDLEAISDVPNTNVQPEVPNASTELPTPRERVMLPVNQRLQGFNKVSNRQVDKSVPKRPEYRKQVEFKRDAESAIKRYAAQPNSGISESGVYSAIEYHGGIDKLTETMRERGQSTMQQVLPSIVNDYKVKLNEDAKASAARIADSVDQSIQTKSIESRDQAVETLRADMKSASKLVDDELFDRAVKAARDNAPEGQMYTPKQVGNFVKRFVGEVETPNPTPSKDSIKKTSKPTAEDSYKELNEYAGDLFVDADGKTNIPREIKKEIDKATRTRNRNNKGLALSDSGMKGVMNKMHKFIDDQLSDLDKALSKPNTLQPTQLADWRRKQAQYKEFKDNIKKADSIVESKAKSKADKLKSDADKLIRSDRKAINSKLDEVINRTKDQEEVRGDVKEAIDSELKGKSEEEVGAISEALVNDIPENLSSTSDVGYQMFDASVDALSGNLSKVGLKDEAKAMRTTRDAIRDAVKRKEEFPDNPDLWLSKSDMIKVSDALGDNASSYMGNLGVKARLAVFGSSNTDSYVVHTTGKIQEMIGKLRKERKEEVLNSGALGDFGINAPDIK